MVHSQKLLERIAIISELDLENEKIQRQGLTKLYFSFPKELQHSNVKPGLIKIAPMQR